MAGQDTGADEVLSHERAHYGLRLIFFWVARMMSDGLSSWATCHSRDVYITGLIRDEHGDKMSKSKATSSTPWTSSTASGWSPW